MSLIREGQKESFQYISALFAEEDQHLLRAKNAALELGVERMMVSPVEGKLLYTLLKIHGARNVVEVGGLTGYSAIWMARALPEDGRLFSLELDATHAEIARDTFEKAGLGQKIKVVQGDAVQMLAQIEKHGPFDAIFIDANKAAYPDYLAWAEKHLRIGGLVMGDNTFLFGQVWKDSPDEGVSWTMLKAMKDFNARLADPVLYDSILVPTVEGLTIAVKKF